MRENRKDEKMCAIRDRKPGFDSEFDGHELKVKLRGEIDHHSAAAVRVSMDDMIRSRTPRRLVLDMSGVDFMDSSGLGLIMGRYTLMQSLGGEICVLDPSPATERIMSLAGMERIISIQRSAHKEREKELSTQKMSREVKKRSAHHRRSGATASVKTKDVKGETK